MNARRLVCIMAFAACMNFVTPHVWAETQVSAGMHSFADNGENQVDTYILQLKQRLQRWNLSLQAAFDRVFLPPLPGLPGSPENVDAITSASRPVASETRSKDDYRKIRREAVGGVQYRADESQVGAKYYYSRESDFLGQQVAAHFGRDLFQKNTNLSVSVALGFDDIEPDEHANGTQGLQERTTQDLTFVWAQSVSPKTLASLGFETTWVRGFQSNPYRQVYAGGARQAENHPDNRFRRAVFAQVDRYLTTRASLSLLARYYSDDWGVDAQSVEARVHQYIGEHLIVRYRYRYHTQNAAYFYRDEYETANGVDGYLTADYRLDDFQSNLFGVKLSLPFENLTVRRWVSGLVMDVKYERYFDSKSFAANVFETGFTWPF